jgi:hypothetical protein
MNTDAPISKTAEPLTTEFLLLPDGTVYAQNLTPTMAAVLLELNPNEEAIRRRVTTGLAKD